MPDSTTAEALAELLAETGRRHHDAFMATDGADPEWPLWYSDYLEGKIDNYLEARPTRSKIIQCLLNAADAHAAHGPDQPWPTFYAHYLLGLGPIDMATAQGPA